MTKFKVGDRVVCINNNGFGGKLVEGKHYLITNIQKDPIRLELDGDADYRYRPDRFRPIVSKLMKALSDI